MTAVSTKSKMSQVPLRRRVGQAGVRLSWGVADQGISSLSNFALGIFAARTLGASDFGAFSLAFITYTVVINAARGLATDPLLVRYSGSANDRWRRATSLATGTALAVGVAAGVVSVAAGLLLPDPVGAAYVALGIALPGLMLQDSWRFAFFASGRGAFAFTNDLFFTVLLLLILVFMHYQGGGSAASCLLALGGTATLAALLGGIQARALPRPLRTTLWLRAQRHLSVRYLLENVSMSGAAQVRSFVLGAVAGLAAVGYVRASEILMGPTLVLVAGLSQVAVPEASRVFHRDSRHLRRFCLVFGGLQAGVVVAWGLILMTVFPLGLGPALIKELWMPTAQLLPAITLSFAAIALVNAAQAGLRAMGIARRSLRAQLTGAAAYLILGSIGAILGGALGASLGVTAAMFIAVLVWWHQLHAALADHHSAPGDRAAEVNGYAEAKSENPGSDASMYEGG